MKAETGVISVSCCTFQAAHEGGDQKARKFVLEALKRHLAEAHR